MSDKNIILILYNIQNLGDAYLETWVAEHF